MNVLDFQDRALQLPPPSDEQLRRIAPDLNKVTSYAMLLLLSDRTTPFLAAQPIWKDKESLRLLRLVDKHLMPEVGRRLKAKARNVHYYERPAAIGDDNCGKELNRKRDRRVRSTTAIMILAVAVVGGLAAYSIARPRNESATLTVARSPEIRRAIPVEPEIRRAIPVQSESNRAIRWRTVGNSAMRRPTTRGLSVVAEAPAQASLVSDTVVTGQHRGFTNNKLYLKLDDGTELTLISQGTRMRSGTRTSRRCRA
jgi:hypothetical protein